MLFEVEIFNDLPPPPSSAWEGGISLVWVIFSKLDFQGQYENTRISKHFVIEVCKSFYLFMYSIKRT